MGERGTLPDVAVNGPITPEELGALWDAWRGGGVALCPRDARPMAVAVDAASHAYRIVCVQCGSASPWFEAKATGIHLRSGTSSMPASRHADD